MAKRLILLLLFFLFSCPLFATTYYVNKSGSDGNSCATAQSATPANAKLTILNAVTNCVVGGDILIIGDGTYTEALRDVIPAGTASFPTTIRASTANAVIMRPTGGNNVIKLNHNYITIDGIDADAVNTTSAPIDGYNGGTIVTNITIKNGTARNGQGDTSSSSCILALNDSLIQNMDIHDCTTGTNQDHGVYVGARNTIENNRIHSNGAYGIQIYSGGGGTDSNIIRNNLVYSNTWYGIWVGTGDDNLVYNNIVYSNGSATKDGIYVYSGDNSRVYNNTIYNNGAYCIAVDASATNAILTNNICYSNTSGAINDAGTNTTCTYNLGVTGGESSTDDCVGATVHDPVFVNAAAGNFRLQSSSPAIDAATSLAGTFTTDADGVVRGVTWDMGAYEYNTSGVGFPLKNIFVSPVIR